MFDGILMADRPGEFRGLSVGSQKIRFGSPDDKGASIHIRSTSNERHACTVEESLYLQRTNSLSIHPQQSKIMTRDELSPR